MNRKQFIESKGATCANWQWSWSFVNEKEKIIIFGAWDLHTDGNTTLILGENWEIDENGRKKPGYKQSREHIRLIEEEGYNLKTYPLIYSNARKDKNGIGPAKIEDFEPKLSSKSLKHIAGGWYASDDVINNLIPEEIENPEQYIEGASKKIFINTYERNADARTKCIKHHGYKCAICSFDFKQVYGVIGEKYIHVHHVIPLAEIKSEYQIDPISDLIPVCPNCHAIIHRTRPALKVEQLKRHLENNENNT